MYNRNSVTLADRCGCGKVLDHLHELVFDFGFGLGAQEIGHDVVGQGRHAVLGDAGQILVALRAHHQRQHAVVAQHRQFLVGQVLHDGRVLSRVHGERVQYRRPADVVPLMLQLEYQSIDLHFELVQLALEVLQRRFQLLVLALHFRRVVRLGPAKLVYTSTASYVDGYP